MLLLDKYSIDGHKLQYHFDRLAQLAKDPLHTYPIYVEISPVGHCNHRCTFCAVDYIGYKTRSLDAQRLCDTISTMAKCGVRSIMFAGEGEPLLHPKLADIINHTTSVGIDVAITTNGVALTPKFIDSCINSISWIKVSCNAGDKETYAKVHQTSEKDWERVWENLRLCNSKRDKSKTVVGIQAVVLPTNIANIEQLVKKAREEGLDYCVLKPYSQHKSSITHEYEDVKYGQYASTLADLDRYNAPGFEVITRNKSMNLLEGDGYGFTKCRATPTLWAYTMANGDVYGCSAYLLDSRFNYGNIYNNSFSEIWLGEKRRASIEYVDKHLDITECRKNCRMSKVNAYLEELATGNKHKNFI